MKSIKKRKPRRHKTKKHRRNTVKKNRRVAIKRRGIRGGAIKKYDNGDVYYGFTKDNMMNGKGIYKYKDGRVFVGNFKDDKKEGPGKMTDSFGRVIHDGQWKDDNYVETKKNNNQTDPFLQPEAQEIRRREEHERLSKIFDDPIGPDDNYVKTKKPNNQTDPLLRRRAQTRRLVAEMDVNDGYPSDYSRYYIDGKQARYLRRLKTLKRRGPNNTGYDGDVD